MNDHDLPNSVDKRSVWSFADVSNLFYSSDNLKQLESVNREVKQIYNYCALNEFSINTAKTSYILGVIGASESAFDMFVEAEGWLRWR